MNGLFKVALKTPYDESDKGLSFTGQLIPATDEEIKAAHGKCGTCKYCYSHLPDVEALECHWSHNPTYIQEHPNEHYCNHHQPKET